MDDIISKFELYLVALRYYTVNTSIAYCSDLQQFTAFLVAKKKNLNTMTDKDIKAYLEHMYKKGLSIASRRRKIETLRTFFAWFHQEYDAPLWSNILELPQKEQRLPHYLTEQEMQKFLSVVDADTRATALRNQLMVYLLYGTGMRISELLALKKDDLNRNTIRVTGKGNRQRIVPIPSIIQPLIEQYLKDHKHWYLFIYENKPITRQAVSSLLKTYGRKANIQKRIHPHLFRHTCATHLLQNGANLRHIQTLLGHVFINNTQIYTHLDSRKMREEYDKKHLRA